MHSSDRTGDFRPSASLHTLQLRAEMLRRLREFFHARGFLEVETPLLSADVVVDRHLNPLSVTLPDDPRRPQFGRTLWLQTSPEFGMKRLMAAGAEAIYQITRAYRAEETGALHNPEFTIVEWYRRGDTMRQGMDLLAEVGQLLLGSGPIDRISYAEAFERHVGVDPHRATVAQLRAAAHAAGAIAPESLGEDRDLWLSFLLAERVEPHLGQTRPTIVYDYPATQAALAQVRGSEPAVAERFELYAGGIELANGYHELLDPAALRRRSAEANRQRLAEGKPALPEESRLLAAMEHGLPQCTGVALGFDRAVMLAVGAKTLAEVMAFPIDRA